VAPLHFFPFFAVTLAAKSVRPFGPTRFSQHHSLPLNPPVITYGAAATGVGASGSSWSNASKNLSSSSSFENLLFPSSPVTPLPPFLPPHAACV